MRPASFLSPPPPPNRQRDDDNDDEDSQDTTDDSLKYQYQYQFQHQHQNQHRLAQHEVYWNRPREQDALFYAPANSFPTYSQHPQGPNIYGVGDDDQGAALEDESSSDYYLHHQAEAVMTPAPVDSDDDDSEYLPDSYPLDDDYDSDYTDHPNYLHHHQLPGDHDLDMSDSDGGVSLHTATMATNAMVSDLDYDSDQHFSSRDDDGEMTDGDDDDEPFNPAVMPNNTLNPGAPGALQFFAPANPELMAAAMGPVLAPHLFLPATPPGEIPPNTNNNINNNSDALDPFPPVQMSNPNPSVLGSENYGLVDFLRYWAYGHVLLPDSRLSRPSLHQILRLARDHVAKVRYSDLEGDKYDMQGIDWEAMNTTREAARRARRFTYKNYVNKTGSDARGHDLSEINIPTSDTFFRFKKMEMRRDIRLAHFQLRSVLACPSRTQAFYPSMQGVSVMNTVSGRTDQAMNLRGFPTMDALAVSTLDAGCGVVMGGTLSGYYCLQALGTEDKKNYSEGQISNDASGITNHIRIHWPRRSGSPIAAIASNDHGFRILDLQTEKFISHFVYPYALNCSAVSPDGRLRTVVGDNLDVLITNAETGEVLQKLSGHRDYGFACDWSDDGYTVATGFQDKAIKIWDARRWSNSSGISTPLCTIRAEMAGVRSLRFSPLGSGKPVLVAAEEADIINIIDAQTFCSKQTIDVFGEIGGVAFANDGQDLNILCSDTHRGGLLQLERCSYGVESSFGGPWQRHRMAYSSSSRDWNDKKTRHPPPYIEGPEVF